MRSVDIQIKTGSQLVIVCNLFLNLWKEYGVEGYENENTGNWRPLGKLPCMRREDHESENRIMRSAV